MAGYCAELFQLEWYSIFLELALLIAMLVTCFLDAFERGRYIYLSYLSMVTFFLSVMARNFITNSFKAGAVNLANLNSDAYNAAAAGAVLLCIVNYALIIFIGLGATMTLPDMQVSWLARCYAGACIAAFKLSSSDLMQQFLSALAILSMQLCRSACDANTFVQTFP